MIDIHSHLLPGVDDGPATMDDAIALCRACVDDGITHSICTPHIQAGRFDNTKTKLLIVFNQLREELQRLNVPLNLSLSAEVHLDPSILQLLKQDEIPFFNPNNNHRYMLLEFPDAQIPIGSDRLVQKLIDLQITPVIAHPERNKGVMQTVDKLKPLLELGCKMQITASSLLGQFGPLVESLAWKLIESGKVTAVASDCHNLAGRRPRMTEAAEKISQRIGFSEAQYLTHTGPNLICQ
jgi:protein-tyrosine phosphatase